MAHNINVLELPPNEFWSILVRFDSLNGTTQSLFFPISFSAKVLIHLPNTVRDKFIEEPSFNHCPWAPVFDAFSLPAKSTKFSCDVQMRVVSWFFYSIFTSIVTIVWALDEHSFIRVEAKVLYFLPSSIIESNSS